ncbi:hypothetical protein [Paenibacillus silvisoli]|uniref:hypothetical protein n=1 Tax=Paenibacillus silvisoli TaxID=3110539 RepID=UPI002805B3A9|nr:hypothetical protein [Paenibacillus silvisoli]
MNNKVFGIGQVTEKGIVFKNIYYSCDVAINGRWFELARVNGDWIVFVILDMDAPDKLMLIDPRSCELVQCYTIKPNTTYGEKLDRYFQSIQMLKSARSQQERKSRRRKTKTRSKVGRLN